MSRLLRIARQHVTIWVITGVWMSLIIVAMIVTLGRRKDTLGTAMIRTWGRMVLSAVQVELRVSPEVQAEFAERRARIVVFNHTSTLDLAIGAAMTPEGGVPVVKRELTRLPILGQVILLTDVLRVDRSNRAATVASLKAAAQRICGERLSVLIAPEGTRSDTGDLGQFKSGPFHLAVQSGAPIVPLVTHGVTAVWPRGAKCSVAGVAMGLIKEGRKFPILSDILGDEDHLGDMDFKVVGNKDGISALQMDIKITGLTRDVLKKALAQAREARLHILANMEDAISAPSRERAWPDRP